MKKLNDFQKLLVSALLGELLFCICIGMAGICIIKNVQSSVVGILQMLLIFFTTNLIIFNSEVVDKYYELGEDFLFVEQIRKHIIPTIIAFIYLCIMLAVIAMSENNIILKITSTHSAHIPEEVLWIWVGFLIGLAHMVNYGGFIRAWQRKKRIKNE